MHKRLKKLAKSSSSAEAFEEESRILLQRFQEALPEVLDRGASRLADRLDKKMSKLLKGLRRDRIGFQKRLYARWSSGIDRLESLIHIAMEFGGNMHESIASDQQAAADAKVVSLHNLHARACRISGEILALLKAGFPDGAHARWRSLHEVAAVCVLLEKSDPMLARKYQEYDAVRRYKAAFQFSEHASLLGWDPVPDSELKELKLARDEVLSRYGKEFGGEYGWACGALALKRVTFADIELHADLKRWRPFYRWASDMVHAGPGGLRALGISPSRYATILAGSINHGLADPGQNAALSLEIISLAFAHSMHSADNGLYSRAFRILARRCQDAFMADHWKMERLISKTEARSAQESHR